MPTDTGLLLEWGDKKNLGRNLTSTLNHTESFLIQISVVQSNIIRKVRTVSSFILYIITGKKYGIINASPLILKTPNGETPEPV